MIHIQDKPRKDIARTVTDLALCSYFKPFMPIYKTPDTLDDR